MKLTKEKILNACEAQLNDWVDEHVMSGHFSTANNLPKWSTDMFSAWQVMQKFRNPVGIKVAFQYILKDCIDIEQGRTVHEMSLMWHITPTSICKAALIMNLDESP